MKKTAKVCISGIIACALILSSGALGFARADAYTGWLTPAWYKLWYSQSGNTAPAQPDPAPQPNESPSGTKKNQESQQPSTGENTPPQENGQQEPQQDQEVAPQEPALKTDNQQSVENLPWTSPIRWAKLHSQQSPSPAETPSQDRQQTEDNSAIQLTADEQKMFQLLNAERKKYGRLLLEMDPALVKVARKKSQDMVDNNYFGHDSPTYGSIGDMLDAEGIKWRLAGENLARHSNVSSAHLMLMDSSIHRSTILNRKYTKVGIGVIRTKTGGIMITQVFIAQ